MLFNGHWRRVDVCSKKCCADIQEESSECQGIYSDLSAPEEEMTSGASEVTRRVPEGRGIARCRLAGGESRSDSRVSTTRGSTRRCRVASPKQTTESDAGQPLQSKRHNERGSAHRITRERTSTRYAVPGRACCKKTACGIWTKRNEMCWGMWGGMCFTSNKWFIFVLSIPRFSSGLMLDINTEPNYRTLFSHTMPNTIQ
ncbi:hypothetical protein C8J57DRAFT_1226393 [Mycena rebaudengoi]|nr:hypothetical protein C8J57DRAFT_1226393 [Mycena rebaudengoi]